MPPILAGLDVLVLSGTGSGKTEAVVAPLMDRFLREGWLKPSTVAMLYVTPTRALANDLLRRLTPPLERLGILPGVRHGEQNDLARARKPDLLITTPESLDVMLSKREPAIRSVRAVVVDEAHLFYNTQRGFQLSVLLKRLGQFSEMVPQVAAMSATVSDAAHIWSFLRPGTPVTVVQETAPRSIDFLLKRVDTAGGMRRLLDAVHEAPHAKVLIFTNSRREADVLGADLRAHTAFGDRVFVHHSSLSKQSRLDVEAGFAAPGKAVCVATSTLELGIDIGDIDAVVLYGHPGGWASFLQRIGRGNRRSSQSNVIAIVTPDHGPIFFQQLAFEALLRQVLAGRFLGEEPLTLLGAGLQQVLSVLAQREGEYVRISDLCALLDAWPEYTPDVVNQLISRLADDDVLLRHAFKDRVTASAGLHRLKDLKLIWGNFPIRSKQVQLVTAGRELGRVPVINAIRLRPGAVFSFGGRNWGVSRILPDRVEVEATTRIPSSSLSYAGSRAPMDPSNLLEILRFVSDQPRADGLMESDRGDFERKLAFLGRFVTLDSIPSVKTAAGYRYFTFAGRQSNRIIAAALDSELISVGELFVESINPMDFTRLSGDPQTYASLAAAAMDSPLDLTIYQTLLPIELLALELGQVWGKSAVTRANLERLRRATEVRVLAADVVDLEV